MYYTLAICKHLYKMKENFRYLMRKISVLAGWKIFYVS